MNKICINKDDAIVFFKTILEEKPASLVEAIQIIEKLGHLHAPEERITRCMIADLGCELLDYVQAAEAHAQDMDTYSEFFPHRPLVHSQALFIQKFAKNSLPNEESLPIHNGPNIPLMFLKQTKVPMSVRQTVQGQHERNQKLTKQKEDDHYFGNDKDLDDDQWSSDKTLIALFKEKGITQLKSLEDFETFSRELDEIEKEGATLLQEPFEEKSDSGSDSDSDSF